VAQAAPPPRATAPVQGLGALTGFATELSADDSGMPPGVVNGPCTPSPAHPFPVVLVHGTFANANLSWQTLAPLLANSGYCVFALNYGANMWTTTFGNHAYGLDYVEHSAAQLDAFILSTVLPDTFEPAGNALGLAAGAHPPQVDVVGHSQGGMMPRYVVDVLGHAGVVHTLVGLAPSNHGTDAYGLVALSTLVFGTTSMDNFLVNIGCPACAEQYTGSAFLAALNAHPDAAGVNYYVVETSDDEVVTPYSSAFLPASENAQNVTLQQQCPGDATDHIGIIYDPVALQDVTSALANNGSVATPLPQPACPAFVPPLVSG
jgi:pimeloyl-ACP methyl ester carboxylesterase